jgi:unsaturated rhamnogalacturonyl hydrolase
VSEAEVLERVRAAADVLERYPFAVWHYGDSVGFEGLLAASDLLGEPRFAAFAYGVVKGWIPRARPYRELDNTAPGHAICELYERTGDGALLRAAEELAEHLVARPTLAGAFVPFERAPLREPYGGGRLSPEEQRLLDDPGAGVFVDCLHFDAPFLVHLGAVTAAPSLVDAGAEQALALTRLLQQPDGSYAHFFLERTGRTYGHGWGRGQGWALLGLLDVLERLPAPHAARPALEAALTRLADVLARTQQADGNWGTPIDEPSSFHERSTALFAAAGLTRGIRGGLIDAAHERVASRAWDAGLDAVGADGAIEGISAALWASTAISHYPHAPVGFQVPWGQGPFLIAARERARSSRGATPAGSPRMPGSR